jgi:hypothetical protein
MWRKYERFPNLDVRQVSEREFEESDKKITCRLEILWASE